MIRIRIELKRWNQYGSTTLLALNIFFCTVIRTIKILEWDFWKKGTGILNWDCESFEKKVCLMWTSGFNDFVISIIKFYHLYGYRGRAPSSHDSTLGSKWDTSSKSWHRRLGRRDDQQNLPAEKYHNIFIVSVVASEWIRSGIIPDPTWPKGYGFGFTTPIFCKKCERNPSFTCKLYMFCFCNFRSPAH